MSIAWKCNRCGKYCGVDDNFRVEVRGIINNEYGEKEYDLCPECRDEFDEFMKGVTPPNLLDRLRAMTKRKD